MVSNYVIGCLYISRVKITANRKSVFKRDRFFPQITQGNGIKVLFPLHLDEANRLRVSTNAYYVGKGLSIICL